MSVTPLMGTTGRGTSLRQIARETLDAIAQGFYSLGDVQYDLAARIEISEQGTQYYPPDSPALSDRASSAPFSTPPLSETDISFLEISTLDGARLLSNRDHPGSGPPAVLNFCQDARRRVHRRRQAPRGVYRSLINPASVPYNQHG
jgi:hypothetical protein